RLSSPEATSALLATIEASRAARFGASRESWTPGGHLSSCVARFTVQIGLILRLSRFSDLMQLNLDATFTSNSMAMQPASCTSSYCMRFPENQLHRQSLRFGLADQT